MEPTISTDSTDNCCHPKQDKSCPVWHILCRLQALTPMLQLTMTGEYAVRAMIHLAALPPDVTAQIADISRTWEVPETFLRKIMSQLSTEWTGGNVSRQRRRCCSRPACPRHHPPRCDRGIEGIACPERMHRRSRQCAIAFRSVPFIRSGAKLNRNSARSSPAERWPISPDNHNRDVRLPIPVGGSILS